jgi:hypothetical protein
MGHTVNMVEWQTAHMDGSVWQEVGCVVCEHEEVGCEITMSGL